MNDSSPGWPAVSFLGSMTVSLIAAADSSPRYWGIKLVCLVIRVLEKSTTTTTPLLLIQFLWPRRSLSRLIFYLYTSCCYYQDQACALNGKDMGLISSVWMNTRTVF